MYYLSVVLHGTSVVTQTVVHVTKVTVNDPQFTFISTHLQQTL